MHTALALFGLLVVLTVIYDVLRTMLMSRGVAPLSGRLMSMLWRVAMTHYGYSCNTEHDEGSSVPPQVGATILLVVIVSWPAPSGVRRRGLPAKY